MRLSLRLWLLVLVLVAAVPVVAVQVGQQLQERQQERDEVTVEARASADLLAERLSQVVAAARALTITVGHLPEVQAGDAAACRDRVRALVTSFPDFVGISAFTPDGNSFCRSGASNETINIADRPYFQEALEGERFVASGYMIGRAINRPTLVFAAPALDEQGNVQAVVLVAFAISELSDMLAEMTLPPGGTASVIDSDGVVVARIPPSASDGERHVRADAFMEAVRTERRGSIVADGQDEVQRVYGFSPLVEPARFYAIVGLPLDPAFAVIDNRLLWNLGLLAAIFILAALAALIGGDFGIRRPLAELQALANRLSNGDLAARTHLDRRALGEVGALANSLDEMASRLEERQTELAASEELNRRILQSSRDCIKVLDLNGGLYSINECGRAALEVDDVSQALGKSYLEFWKDQERAAARAAMDSALAGGVGRFLGSYLTPSGRQTWWDEVITPISNSSGQPERLLVVSREVTDAKRAEEQRELLMAELDHRVKNTLAAVQSVAWQTLKSSGHARDFAGRLEAMSKAHSLLSGSRWEGAELGSLLRTMLDPYGDRVQLEGAAVHIDPKATQTLGMAIHELATNAAKYGALSVPGGRVMLHWHVMIDGSNRLVLEWSEEGGPAVAKPRRRGFGLTLLERSLSHEFGGAATLDFHPDGLRCTLELTLSAVAAASAPAAHVPRASPADVNAIESLAGKRVLLVEDTVLAAMELEALLAEAGCVVVGPAARLDRALGLAESEALDAAILDVNLDGTLVFPLAELLRQKGVPFIFMTGYNGRAIFPQEFQEIPRVGKPVQGGVLVSALVSALGENGAIGQGLPAGVAQAQDQGVRDEGLAIS